MPASFHPRTVVLDLETRLSATNCKFSICNAEQHRWLHTPCPGGEHIAIGWDNHRKLGLSIGCYWSAWDDQWHCFDMSTLTATMKMFLDIQARLVTFNGKQFDLPLMLACSRFIPGDDAIRIADWWQLITNSYDLLAAMWDIDPAKTYEKGNGLGAVSEANGYGKKVMDGATAPQLWAAGKYAEVVDYCLADVWKTKKLFAQVLRGEPIRRGNGLPPIKLPLPAWGMQETAYADAL